jgi:flavodoxin
MKVLIAYHSVSGNTRKVAEAIYKEIKADKEMKALNDVKDLKGYDLSFIGLPIHAYGPANEAKAFLEKKAAGKEIALFITHASPEDEPLVQQWLAACKIAASSANIVGLFHCRGELAQNVADMMIGSKDPQLAAWAERRKETLGQPDAERLKKARKFAKEIMGKYKPTSRLG